MDKIIPERFIKLMEGTMQCKKLKSFLSAAGNWKIMSCQAARLPYVPSIEELEKLCSGRKHCQCRIYHNFLREEMSSPGVGAGG